jgi:hypothetical protein
VKEYLSLENEQDVISIPPTVEKRKGEEEKN